MDWDWLGPVIAQVIGTGITAGAQNKIASQERAAGERIAASEIRAGITAKTSADFEAAQLEQRAGLTRATSQRAAEEVRLESALLQSRALAVAAASGAGASDSNIITAIARIAARGEYGARSRLFEGEVAGNRFIDAARARRYEGEQAMLAGYERAHERAAAAESRASAADTNSMNTILKGSLSLFDRFGRSDAPASVIASSYNYDYTYNNNLDYGSNLDYDYGGEPTASDYSTWWGGGNI